MTAVDAELKNTLALTIPRDDLMKPLQLIVSTVDKKQALPILSNILFSVSGNRITMTGTDLEVELIQHIQLTHAVAEPFELAIPAKKLFDICRSLPAGSELSLKQVKNHLKVTSGRSRFSLALLPPGEFPTVEKTNKPVFSFKMTHSALRRLFEKTQFSMAQQDVRYFLNGLLLDINGDHCNAVTTDGHRLSMSSQCADFALNRREQVLIPRKAVTELIKLLSMDGGSVVVDIEVGENYISLHAADFIFTSKLIDGQFPEYRSLIPKKCDNVATIERQLLKDALTRVSVLSNDKFRGAWLNFKSDRLVLQANNPERDEANEEIMIEMAGEGVRLGCNVTYILEVLNVLDSEYVKIMLGDANTSMLIKAVDADDADDDLYVVMPMCL